MLPRRNDEIMYMVVLPTRLQIRADAAFARHVRCYLDGSWLSVMCTSHNKSNCARAFRQCFPPFFDKEGKVVRF